jgi:hypothetical protein
MRARRTELPSTHKSGGVFVVVFSSSAVCLFAFCPILLMVRFTLLLQNPDVIDIEPAFNDKISSMESTYPQLKNADSFLIRTTASERSIKKTNGSIVTPGRRISPPAFSAKRIWT